MIKLALLTFAVNVSYKVRNKREMAVLSISYSYILPFFLKPGVADLWMWKHWKWLCARQLRSGMLLSSGAAPHWPRKSWASFSQRTSLPTQPPLRRFLVFLNHACDRGTKEWAQNAASRGLPGSAPHLTLARGFPNTYVAGTPPLNLYDSLFPSVDYGKHLLFEKVLCIELLLRFKIFVSFF